MMFAVEKKSTGNYHQFRKRDGSGFIFCNKVCTYWIFKEIFSVTKELFNRLRIYLSVFRGDSIENAV